MHETLIVRLPNWLGDTVMAVPALRALRAARPEARIVLVGPWATCLTGQGLGDVLVPYGRSWSARLARWDEIRGFGAAAALLLPNSLEAAIAAWYWRAPRRIGLDAGARRRLLTDAIPMPEPREHQVDEYARVVAGLGVAVDDRVPSLAPPPDDAPERATVRGLLRETGVGGDGRTIVAVHLGAAFGPSKLWPAERIAELCRLLAGRGQVPVLLGARDDADLAARLVADTGVASLVGRDGPDLLTAVLAEVDALVCGDTGVGHLAAALGTPVAALFGPTDPRLSAPRGRVRVLVHPVPCSPCFYRVCPIEHPCLRGIEAVRVGDALTGLTATAASPARR
jgi:heptosyltransferase-2